jgi:predicted permease
MFLSTYQLAVELLLLLALAVIVGYWLSAVGFGKFVNRYNWRRLLTIALAIQETAKANS